MSAAFIYLVMLEILVGLINGMREKGYASHYDMFMLKSYGLEPWKAMEMSDDFDMFIDICVEELENMLDG